MTQQDKTAGKTASTDDNKSNAGLDRQAPDLDASQQWDEVATDTGFQSGEQDGYKGHYDETKYQQIEDKDVNPDETRKARDDAATTAGAARGDDDGRRTPMSQNERTEDRRSND